MHLAMNLSSSSKVSLILKWILVLNLIVFGIKLFIGLKAHSLSILGDAVHSGIDSFNNIIGLVMIRLAAQPPDQKHPYGHAKFETLGALAVVAFLAITSFELLEKSVMRFFNPGDYPHIDRMTIYLLLVTLVINIFVWLYESRAGKKLNSQLLQADAAHTFSDILVTVSILCSVFFIARGYLWLDPFLGIVIAVVIVRGGWKILKQTVPLLVDEAWIREHEINDLIMSTDKVVSYADLRSRKGNHHAFVEMTVRFDTDSLKEAHDLSHQIETKIVDKFGKAEVLIHIEPS
ncbi:MAG: cation diffusion facilitator family transporter [Cyanobacteria bacterium]|nr:cation diffusion facilitator family transporter [Cyanobacteriota bacterium]MDA1021286.1 cation diffusion facilitator family transporter [Cyanobacteriota bacterium]